MIPWHERHCERKASSPCRMKFAEQLASFAADFDSLSPGQKAAFLASVEQFIDDLRRGEGFRKGLRVKVVKGAAGIIEMTWADDGRATFEYGKAVRQGEPHIMWRRIGAHAILHRP